MGLMEEILLSVVLIALVAYNIWLKDMNNE